MTTEQIPTTFPEAAEFIVKYFTEKAQGFRKLLIGGDIFFRDDDTLCDVIEDPVFTTWFGNMAFTHGLQRISVERGVDCHYATFQRSRNGGLTTPLTVVVHSK